MTSDVTRQIGKVPLKKPVAAPPQSALRTALAGLIGNVLE
jgi:hypothetical protein